MDDQPDRSGRPASSGQGRASYDRDLYSWAVEQAALLRAGRIGEADAVNIAEELDDVGNEQYDKLESAIRIILLHLLKWDHQHERRSRSWHSSIKVQRKHVEKVLRKSPGLRPHIEEAIAEAFETARIEAADEMDRDEGDLPETCPYNWTQIMERQISWPPAG